MTRISLGAQSLQPHLLETLERRAQPETVTAAVALLRAAGHQNLNLDLMFGIPGQSGADLRADIEGVLALEPDHISWYELEAKPGTRFAIHHGAELARQADALEDHYETVVAALRGAGYRWYETANFCRPGYESRHNLGYWLGHDYLGVGVGAVSTLGLERRRNRPRLARLPGRVRRRHRAAVRARAVDGVGAGDGAADARTAARSAARAQRPRRAG